MKDLNPAGVGEKRPGAVPYVLILALLGASAFVVMAGVGYVWQKKELQELGWRLREKERELEGLKRLNSDQAREWAEKVSPRALARRVNELGLKLGMPMPHQIVELRDGELLMGDADPEALAVAPTGRSP